MKDLEGKEAIQTQWQCKSCEGIDLSEEPGSDTVLRQVSERVRDWGALGGPCVLKSPLSAFTVAAYIVSSCLAFVVSCSM